MEALHIAIDVARDLHLGLPDRQLYALISLFEKDHPGAMDEMARPGGPKRKLKAIRASYLAGFQTYMTDPTRVEAATKLAHAYSGARTSVLTAAQVQERNQAEKDGLWLMLEGSKTYLIRKDMPDIRAVVADHETRMTAAEAACVLHEKEIDQLRRKLKLATQTLGEQRIMIDRLTREARVKPRFRVTRKGWLTARIV